MRCQILGICWLLTEECNLRCPMCYRFIGEQGKIDLKAKYRIARKIADERIRKVTFAGGEPLLDSDLADIVRYLSQRGVKTALCTNGELMSNALIAELSPFLDEVTIAVDGSTPKIHGAMRSSNENWQISLRLLREIKRHPICLDVSTVVTRVNIDDLMNIRNIVADSGVCKWKLFQFYPLGIGKNNRSQLEISREQFVKIQKRLVSSPGNLQIDFRDSREETMRSYIHISPTGRMLIVDRSDYHDIGSFLDCKDLVESLNRSNFSFEIHAERHWRDKFEYKMQSKWMNQIFQMPL